MHLDRKGPEGFTKQGQLRRGRFALAGLGLGMLWGMAGCNGLPSNTQLATETPKNVPQTYMAPVVGSGQETSQLQSYTFDTFENVTSMDTFAQATSQLTDGTQSEINNSGDVVPLARNLLELETTYTYPPGRGGAAAGVTGTTYPVPPATGALPPGWAVLLPDKTGGLVQLFKGPYSGALYPNQPVTPLVEAVCPNSTKAQTYQFLTIPSALSMPSAGGTPVAANMWNPAYETAYGSVDVSGTGGSVMLANTQQSAFPISGASLGTTPAPSATGVCGPTVYGNTISVPGGLTITSPGNGQSVSATATIGISASGLLVEDNGSANASASSAYANGLFYQNALGAGTGAIGMLKPSSAVNTGSVVAAQYNGFVFGTGNIAGGSNFSSTVASFGFSTVPASCASVTSPTSTLIYGGDFPKNDPSAAAVQSAGGFGNCDYAIDLGTQDSAKNGLYPAATVWVGGSFGGNSTGKAYSFPAVALAGTVAGKNAIFLLGVDTTGTPNQAVGIYLLQSN